MKSHPTRILAASLLVLLVCFPSLAQSKRRPQSSTTTKKPPAAKAESEDLALNPPTKRKMECSTEPPMDAETEQTLKLAGQRNDFGTTKQVSRQMIRSAPDVCGWYVMFVYAVLKSPPNNEAEADDVLFVIREFQRKKLPAHDWETVQHVKINTYKSKSEMAFAKGDFAKGVAELRKVILLGDAIAKVSAHMKIATAYGPKYFNTQARSDAVIARDELRAALSDSVALKEFLSHSATTSDSMIITLHGMLGLMENDLGNFNAAITELELAQSLVRNLSGSPDSTISRMIEIAKQNLQSGGKSPSVRIVSIREIVEALK